MRTITMLAPSSASGFSHEGRNYEVEDGKVEVLEQDVAVAESHGYETVGGTKPTSGRSAMVHAVSTSARAVVEGSSDETLSSFLALSADDQNKFWESMSKNLAEYPLAIVARQKADEEDRTAEEKERERLAAAKAADQEAKDRAAKDAEIAAAKKAAEADSAKKTTK